MLKRNNNTAFDPIPQTIHQPKGAIRAFIKEVIDLFREEKTEYWKKKRNGKVSIHTSRTSDGDNDSTSNNVGDGMSAISSIIESSYQFRIMGRVINIEPMIRSSLKPFSQLYHSGSSGGIGPDPRYVLRLDDGTAIISVVITSEQRSNIHKFSVGDCIDCVGKLQILISFDHHHGDEDIVDKSNNDDNDNQMKKSQINKKEKKDCDNNSESIHNTNDSHNHHFYVIAKSCSKVTDPNLETLRMLELSTNTARTVQSPFVYYEKLSNGDIIHKEDASEHTNHDDELARSTVKSGSTSSISPSLSSRSCKENGVYMYGDLVSKLAPFQRLAAASATASFPIKNQNHHPHPPQLSPLSSTNHSLNNTNKKSKYLQRIETFHLQKQLQPKLIVYHDQIMNFIEYSQPDGLTENDLILLFDCKSGEEIQALKDELEDMRANFDIYITKTGSYLPL